MISGDVPFDLFVNVSVFFWGPYHANHPAILSEFMTFSAKRPLPFCAGRVLLSDHTLQGLQPRLQKVFMPSRLSTEGKKADTFQKELAQKFIHFRNSCFTLKKGTEQMHLWKVFLMFIPSRHFIWTCLHIFPCHIRISIDMGKLISRVSIFGHSAFLISRIYVTRGWKAPAGKLQAWMGLLRSWAIEELCPTAAKNEKGNIMTTTWLFQVSTIWIHLDPFGSIWIHLFCLSGNHRKSWSPL